MRKLSYLASLALFCASTAFSQNLTIQTWAGGGIPVNQNAASASLGYISGVAIYGGNIYMSLQAYSVVVMWNPASGNLTLVAGNGTAGYSGDLGPATAAQLHFPAGLAVDSTGAIYIADSGNNCVRKALPGGTISTILGGTNPLALVLATPTAVAVDRSSTIYVAEYSSPVVHSYTPAGVWSYLAGSGAPGYSGDGGPATVAELMIASHDMAVDAAGDVFIADGMRVRKVNVAGTISTVAGDGYMTAIGDGTPATTAILNHPSGVAVDGAGNLFIADTGTERVRIVLATGIIQTLAGDGTAGYNGDRMSATEAELRNPMGLAMDPWGNLFVADTANQRVRQITGGIISTFAGTGTTAPLAGPQGVCTGGDGTVYIVDTQNDRVLAAPPGGVVATFAGNGSPGYVGDGDLALFAQLNLPAACALDTSGNLFIADTGNHSVRQVNSAGVISTVAGSGACGYSGDGAVATSAVLCGPTGVAADGNGNIFIADTGNHAIRMVAPDGLIHTIAGQGAPGFSGDDGAALSASLDLPSGMTLDGAGDLYFADTGNNRVRRLTPPGDTITYGTDPPSALELVNAAGQNQGAVAPGEIVTIYGSDIGPTVGVTGAVNTSGLIGGLLAGVDVTFDGVAAPLFYAQATQINAQAPYTIAGQNFTQVTISYLGLVAGTLNLPVAPSAPGLFAVAFNQDGSLNSASAPAARGTVVIFAGTGEGLTNGPNIAGQAAIAPYPIPLLPVTLTVDGIAAQLPYAGEAPGFSGLLQVNAVMPGGFIPSGAVAVQLAVGEATSPTITVWLQ